MSALYCCAFYLKKAGAGHKNSFNLVTLLRKSSEKRKCVRDVYTLATGSTTLAAATAQTGTTRATFGGMGGGTPGMTPPDAANGQTPPEKPAGSPSGTPPEMPAQNNATSQAEIAAG